ncbi:hypothetical protein [Faecalimonas sp.]
MDYKLPYYMTYPMPFEYDDERKERQDIEYMKSLYPITVKKILPFVEDECERMEYEGSMIYDEYPDMLGIRLMCNRICERVEAMDRREDIEDELEMQQKKLNNRENIRNIVEVLLLHELMKKRNEYRRRRRRFY